MSPTGDSTWGLSQLAIEKPGQALFHKLAWKTFLSRRGSISGTVDSFPTRGVFSGQKTLAIEH